MSSGSPDDVDGNELAVLPGGRIPDEEARIGGQNNLTGVQLQVDRGEQGSSSDTSQDEWAGLLDELRAETGFDSYSSFLAAYEERFPDLKDLKNSFDWEMWPNLLSIYDVHQEASRNLKTTLQCSSSSPTVILTSLRQPPATAIFRVVLWDASECTNKTMITAVGLGLRIQPDFFHAIISRNRAIYYQARKLKEQELTTKIVAMAHFVMTVARHYLPANSNLIPVVLIAGGYSGALTDSKFFHEVLHFQRPSLQATTEQINPSEQPSSWMQDYVRLLEADLAMGTRSDESNTDLILRSLNPLLHFQIFRIHEECRSTRKEYLKFTRLRGKNKEGDLGALFTKRSSLRRFIEGSEDQFQHLQRFKLSEKESHKSQDASSIMVEDDLQRALQGAHRLEAEIRDYLQLQTGDLALRESIKSIELSNTQIEEAKRG